VAYFEPNFLQHSGGMLAAYVFGLIGYTIAGAALYGGAVVNFDSLVGRVGRDFVPKRRPPRIPTAPRVEKAAQDIIVAETVDE
jgi:hypothetical protein